MTASSASLAAATAALPCMHPVRCSAGAGGWPPDNNLHYDRCPAHYRPAVARLIDAARESGMKEIRQELFALCETTEDEYKPDTPAIVQDGAHYSGLLKDYGGKPNPEAWRTSEFMRGRAYEAKHIRQTIGEVIAAAIRARKP